VPEKSAVRGIAAALGRGIPQAGEQKESGIEEGHLLPDHVHMMIAIPPKYAVSQVIGFIKGEERDPSGQGVWGDKEELRGAALLGARILRIHSGAR
jgi:REP element-mobilizing transposase RayT